MIQNIKPHDKSWGYSQNTLCETANDHLVVLISKPQFMGLFSKYSL